MQTKIRLIRIILVGTVVVAGIGNAAILNELDEPAESMDQLIEGSVSLFTFQRPFDDSDSAPLAEIARNYQEGDQLDAKAKLALMLRDQPSNGKAWEVAGTIYLIEQRLPLARAAFEAALRISGTNNSRAVSRLGVVTLLQGDPDRARRMFELALKLEPENRVALVYYARVAESKGDYSSAAAAYQRLHLLARNQPKQQAKYLVAMLSNMSKAKQYKAIATLLPLSVLESMAPDTRYASAGRLLLAANIELGEWAAANSVSKVLSEHYNDQSLQLHLQKVILAGQSRGGAVAARLAGVREPKNDQERRAVQYALARGYALAGDLETSSELLQQLAGEFADNNKPAELLEVLSVLSTMLLEQQRRREALSFAARYQKQFPQYPLLALHLAELQVSTAQTEQAITSLKRITAENSEFIPAFLLLSRLHRQRNEYDAAEKQLLVLLEKRPNAIRAWGELAAVHVAQKQFDGAIRVLKEGLEKNPDSTGLMFELAVLHEQNGRADAAVTLYQKLISVKPDHVPALDNLAGLHLERGEKLDEALTLSKRAQALMPEDDEIRLVYARALLSNGNNAAALEQLKRIDDSTAADGRVAFYAGWALSADKKVNEAREHFARALEVGLDVKNAAQARAWLDKH